MKTPERGCPVCGYPDFVALDNGSTNFEICPACGCQSGYTFDEETRDGHLEDVRRHWLYNEGGKWWSSSDPMPPGWDPIAQMLAAGIPIPTKEKAR